MRSLSALFVGVLAVMASCGSTPDVPEDTEGVAGGPQAPGEEPAPAAGEARAAEPPEPAAVGPSVPNEDVAVGFAEKARFIVFARAGEASFLVFDREANETFRVLGEPMGEASPSYDMFSEAGLASGARKLRLVEDASGHVLVRSPGGVQLVDLADRGRMLAAWRGAPSAVSVAPDGGMFAVATPEAMHLVRVADNAIATYPASLGEGGQVASWGERAVTWTTEHELTRVDRATFGVTKFAGAPGERSLIVASSEADVVAVARTGDGGAPGSVAVYVGDGRAPVVRVASSVVSELVVDKDAATVAWLERLADPNAIDDRAFIHAVDVATRAHVRFPAKGSGCMIAPEMLGSVHDGKIVTDASCRIGCPSVRWTDRAVTYDARTGQVLSDTSVTEEKSYNEESGEARERVEAVAARLGIEAAAMAHPPRTDSVLVARARGPLTLVGLADPGAPPVSLEGSEGASLDALTFSEDGAIVAGVVGERARAWDLASGRALLR